MHAFDLANGAEILALIPPDLLGLQKKLYDQYKKAPVDCPVGQKSLPGEHAYGVANSPRFADIFDPAGDTDWKMYRTVLFLTEGPGGTGLHAIDITHPYRTRTYADGTSGPTDPDYAYGLPDSDDHPGPPVQPLWSLTKDGKSGTTALPDLGYTWSIPAVGGTSNSDNWELVLGNGYILYDETDAGTKAATQNPRPRYLRLDPLLGFDKDTHQPRANEQLTNIASDQPLGGPWVRNQLFADSTIWSTSAPFFRPDNDVNQGVQLDLQGQVWLIDRESMVTTNWNTPVLMSDPEGKVAGDPLYFSAAVASYPASDNPQYDVYAFSSGSFYETSKYITGDDVGTTGHFIPSLYIVSRPVTGGTPVIYKKEISSIPFGLNNSQHFGPTTQITANQLLLAPQTGTGDQMAALFLVYDPSANFCLGTAYLVELFFNPGVLATTPPTILVASAGEGAAAGYAVAGSRPVVAKSFIGAEGKAYLHNVELKVSGFGGTGGRIAWWMELQ